MTITRLLDTITSKLSNMLGTQVKGPTPASGLSSEDENAYCF
jgi:hypothetical protein